MKEKAIIDIVTSAKFWRVVFIIAIIVVVIVMAVHFYKWWLIQKQLIQQGKSTVLWTDPNSGVNIQIDLTAKATQLHNDLHTGLWGYFENESGVKETLLTMPKELMPQLESVYSTMFGENLQETVQKYCTSIWDEVKYLFGG